jgi:hypothetical protein
LFVESGGDNLAANYSRELADYIIYVVGIARFLPAVERVGIADSRSTSLAGTRCPGRAGLALPSPTCSLVTR